MFINIIRGAWWPVHTYISYIYIYRGSSLNVNHFLVVNVRTAESVTRGGWLDAKLSPRRMTRRDSWEGIELKGGTTVKAAFID